MKAILKIEELAQFIAGILIFNTLDYSWWVFLALLLTPDIGMLGYVINAKLGAFIYNVFHHKAIGIGLIAMGYFYWGEPVMLVGVILFSHAAFDRIFGYGLKYNDHFKQTHLGAIGK